MDTPTLHKTIKERLAELAEAEQRVKMLRGVLQADYEALREALPRTRKRTVKAVAAKRGRPRRASQQAAVETDARD